MTKAKQKKWILNLLKFTAPVMAIFFLQLSQGVDWKLAGTVAMYAMYSAISDLLKKIK